MTEGNRPAHYTPSGPLLAHALFDQFVSKHTPRERQVSMGAYLDHTALVVLSGGLDSTVLAYFARTLTEGVAAVSFNYGQRHVKELEMAAATCAYLGIQHTIVDLRGLGGMLKSTLTGDGAVPHGLYDEDNMKATVVPNRNMIMLSIAAGIAQSRGIAYVLTAVHAGDHVVYADCRPQFIEATSRAVAIATESVSVVAPFNYLTKTDIVEMGAQLDVDWSLTWSCYEGGEAHCGQCGTCTERIEAFHNAKVKDPTEYAEGGREASLAWLASAGKLKVPTPHAN